MSSSVLNLRPAVVGESVNVNNRTTPPRHELVDRIKAFILQHLRDPELTVGTVAAAFRISNRYVHKLFEGQGATVSEYVRRLRLENCCRDLVSARYREVSITQIAFSWGFNNTSHFSYLFRQYHGMPASEYRRQYAGAADSQIHAPTTAARH